MPAQVKAVRLGDELKRMEDFLAQFEEAVEKAQRGADLFPASDISELQDTFKTIKEVGANLDDKSKVVFAVSPEEERDLRARMDQLVVDGQRLTQKAIEKFPVLKPLMETLPSL